MRGGRSIGAGGPAMARSGPKRLHCAARNRGRAAAARGCGEGVHEGHHPRGMKRMTRPADRSSPGENEQDAVTGSPRDSASRRGSKSGIATPDREVPALGRVQTHDDGQCTRATADLPK